MKQLLPAFTAILFTLSARASRAEAEQPISPKAKETFGDRGNVVIGGDFSFSFERYHMDDNSSLTGFGAHPSLDYFVLDHLSIGTSVGITRRAWALYGTDTIQTELSAAPRIGYEIPLGEAFSLWPSAGISYFRSIIGGNLYALYADPQWSLSGYVRAPLIAHVAKHFFVGGGPSVGVNFRHSDRVLSGSGISFESTVGGWI